MSLEIVKKTDNGIVIENILHDSSNVLKTSYNYNTKQLYVTFKTGAVYYYNEVAHHIYESLKTAPSVGKFLNQEIKPKHTVVIVGKATPEILSEMVNKISTYKNNANS